ncbi:MAG: aminotransferase class I/II-fold pyridoxal phosphate-dependent enzyme [Tepidanaerobacteraceae bacterium]|jgi:cystathionine beta-lyase family protein involved in aluminum resistance
MDVYLQLLEHNLKEKYNLSDKIISLYKETIEEIQPYINHIDKLSELNQLKVISAMTEANLSDFHLTESTGYGYGDIGREAIEQIYSLVFKADNAIVRPQIVSGTHAITVCLFGLLRPNDTIVSVMGSPYDTLKNVIIGENCGSLKEYNIGYSEVALTNEGKPDLNGIRNSIKDNTKMVLIQRSRGYSLRGALTIDEIAFLIKYIKNIHNDIIIFVDNCYGEFVDIKEPTEVGADLLAGSLIKNIGGGIAPTGGYIVGKDELIEQCSYRATAPGLGKNCGPSLSTNRLLLQGLYFAPFVVGEALKGAIFTSRILEKAGFKVYPKYNEPRGDIVTSVVLGDEEKLIHFCRGIQKTGPVDSKLTPEPWGMPGYNHKVIMAGGSFIQGSSIELSADGPLREPYAVYIQGGTNLLHAKLGVLNALQELADHGLWNLDN